MDKDSCRNELPFIWSLLFHRSFDHEYGADAFSIEKMTWQLNILQ